MTSGMRGGGALLAPPAPHPRVPWLSGALAALALVIAAVPGAGAALALERGAVEAGEWWRLISGHWVHWSTGHLLWDVGAFAALGIGCELRSRRRFAACVAGSALAISAAFWWGLPQLSHYGGLSGIDCALVAPLCAELWLERRSDRLAAALAAALALALVGKVGFEWATGATLFVSNLGAGAVPVPAAHAVGAALGLAVPCFCRRNLCARKR